MGKKITNENTDLKKFFEMIYEWEVIGKMNIKFMLTDTKT